MSGRPSISITRSRGTRSVGRTAFKYSDMPLTKSRKYTLLAASVIAAVLIIDQIIKVWIKTHFYIGEDFEIASWFHLRFVQNDGMAFGLNLFSDRVRTFIRIAVLAALGFYCADLVERKARRARLVTAGVITGLWAVYTLWCFFKGNLFDIPLSSGFAKLALSLFRVVFVVALFWYMRELVRRATVPTGYIACVALVVAGALGNIIDCLFYGMIFTNPAPYGLAHLVPWGEGYGTFFHGLVVDMFYFPLFEFTWPQWMPWLGGQHASFFDPVFNFADAAISVGIIAILLFYRRYLDVDTALRGKNDETAH